MSKHTPGPWGPMASLSDDETIAWTPIQGKLEAAPGLTIGSPHHTEPICRVSGYLQPVVANARLIAAAPEMLEALEQTRKALKYCQKHVSHKHALVVDTEILKVDDAIARATGEECD